MTPAEAIRSGEVLKERRNALGLSRARLAGLAGCTPNYIATLEGGYLPVRSDVRDRIIAALDKAEAGSKRKAA